MKVASFIWSFRVSKWLFVADLKKLVERRGGKRGRARRDIERRGREEGEGVEGEQLVPVFWGFLCRSGSCFGFVEGGVEFSGGG